MKFLKMLAISLFVAALTTAVFAAHVSVDYDHATNFSRVKTYSWSKIHTANSIWDDRVKDAVDKELAAKGWVQVPSGGMLRWRQSRKLPCISNTTPSTTALAVGDAGAASGNQPPQLTTTRWER
jgi:Domain of unknown function (DUF4136)